MLLKAGLTAWNHPLEQRLVELKTTVLAKSGAEAALVMVGVGLSRYAKSTHAM